MRLKLDIGSKLFFKIGNIEYTRVVLDTPFINFWGTYIKLITDGGIIKISRDFSGMYSLNHLITGINFNLIDNVINFGEGRVEVDQYTSEYFLMFKDFYIIMENQIEFLNNGVVYK